jgi:hypothetical protein
MGNRTSSTSLLFNAPSKSFILNCVEDVDTNFACRNQEINLQKTGNFCLKIYK